MKEAALKKNGTFNQSYENVTANIFKINPFFDRMDTIQVKYEMIRATANAEGNITEVSGAYGYSRKSYYQINKAFEAGGIYALVPKKTGPKKPHKMNQDAERFIDAFLEGHAKAKAKEISAALEAETGIKVHPRTVYRYLKKNGY